MLERNDYILTLIEPTHFHISVDGHVSQTEVYLSCAYETYIHKHMLLDHTIATPEMHTTLQKFTKLLNKQNLYKTLYNFLQKLSKR